MKLMLKVNLKIGSGQVVAAGTVFDDSKEPIPEFMFKRLRRGQAEVIPEPSSVSPPPQTEAKVSVNFDDTSEEKKKQAAIIARKEAAEKEIKAPRAKRSLEKKEPVPATAPVSDEVPAPVKTLIKKRQNTE
jgi:hypothetical protein